jgi:hypothetical protein
MSCSAPPKLLSYYSNKVNIYNNDCYIPLPSWNSCPPPPQIYLAPEYVYPPAGPYIPPETIPLNPPLNYPGAPCASAPCGPCGGGASAPCGPCGGGRAPCGPCGR